MRLPARATDLTVEERIGQVLCLGWQGASPDESRTINHHARAIVQVMHCGSVVLLGRNVDAPDPEQTRHMLGELQSLARIPLFIAVDQEGGRINRFRPPFTQFPGNMALGAIAGIDFYSDGLESAIKLAYRQARAQARELLAVGVNWNFAPVVDVNNNPDNPIIGVRSYGENADMVARLGIAAAAGYESMGMLACAKHFPGHGDTNVDSHLALPTVSGDRARLDRIELLPFRRLIQRNIGAIMTTHIVYPALDPERPATLSRAILTDLLRTELGYDGLVITDCLEMEAIAGTIGTARGAAEALKAGADVALISHTLDTQRAAFAAIRDAVESGELPESRLNEAVDRVLAAKCRFLSDAPSPQGSPWFDPAHKELEREIARASITVVRNSGAIPLRPPRGTNIVVMSIGRRTDLLCKALSTRHPHLVTAVLHSELLDSDLSSAFDIADRCRRHSDILIVASKGLVDANRRSQLMVGLLRIEPSLILVAPNDPYDLRRFPGAVHSICTYGDRPASLEALAGVLFGEYEPTGRGCDRYL